MTRIRVTAIVALLLIPVASLADESAADKPPALSLGKGRFVRISLRGIDRTLALAEVEVIETGTGKQLEKGATASQSSVAEEGDASRAIDGNKEGDYSTGRSVSHTATEQDPWWSVDLGAVKDIGEIRIHNRSDCCGGRFNGAVVEIRDADDAPAWISTIATAEDGSVHAQKTLGKGRYVRVTLEGMDHVLSLAEVQVRETGTGKELQKTAKPSQSTTDFEGDAKRAADGNTNQDFYNGSTSHTQFEQNPSWEVDFENVKDIGQIKIYNRGDCCSSRLKGAIVEILDENYNAVWKGTIADAYDGSVHEFAAP